MLFFFFTTFLSLAFLGSLRTSKTQKGPSDLADFLEADLSLARVEISRVERPPSYFNK